MNGELSDLDATAQAELVASGEVSPAELVDDAIARIEKLNPQLNAMIHERFEKARAEAASPNLPQGPFRGVPFLLKDLDAHSAGDPFHQGLRFLKELGWIERTDSYIVSKLRAAGFVIVGKTNCSELGLVPTTEPEAYGPTHNPWNLEHSPGGSSGGAAAAVAARMVSVAHATDGGGSIRIPASECGLVGLKPTRGRVSFGPTMHEPWHGFVCQHVVSRTVRDTAAVLDVVAGAMPGDPDVAPPPGRPYLAEVGADPGTLRIGVMTAAPARLTEVHPDCAAAALEAGKLLESLGHRVEEISGLPGIDDPSVVEHFLAMVTSWTAFELDQIAAKTGVEITAGDVEPGTWAYNEMGRTWTGPQYLSALDKIHSLVRTAAQWWADGFDLLVTPTIAEPPPRLGEFKCPPDNPFHASARAMTTVAFAAPLNVTGQPAVTLPLHQTDNGLPIGVQLAAAYGREDLLIAVAAQIEEARPWAEDRPPIS